MDRRFLSDERVIKASRDFVCIRTATYEDKKEAVFLKSLFVRRPSGSLRNFGFCILAPDGERQLRRSNRGPNFVYADSKEMAADLRRVAAQFADRNRDTTRAAAVPRMKTVRLGINVASCDGLPSVIVAGSSKEQVDAMNKKLSQVIWTDELAGKFIFASTTRPADLQIIKGAKVKSGILVVRPDEYGTRGDLIVAILPDVSTMQLKTSLTRAADSFRRLLKSHGSHVRYGRRTNRIWQTEVPVPDRTR